MPSSTFSPETLPDLTGRVYLITGGNAGIGKATTMGLALRGAKVFMGARSEEKALAAIQDIKTTVPNAQVEFLLLDLSSLQSVISAARSLHDRETRLDGLINNAGIMGVPFALTADGYESQFQTNYLSHWLLTVHLLPILQITASKSVEGAVRVVNVTSDGHASFAPKGGISFEDTALEKESAMARYGQSKLANVLHANELHHRFGPNIASKSATGKILFASVHPGHIDTALNKQATGAAPSSVLRAVTPIMRCLGILDSQVKGAWSSLFAVASDEFKPSDSGAYVVPYAKFGTPSAHARDRDLATRLWEWTSEEMRAKGFLEH